VCTMALSLSHAYPGALDAAAEVLGLINRKDKDRERRVRRMWTPRKVRKGEDPSVLYWFDTPELRADLHTYCTQDVVTERELHHRLAPLSNAEQDAWALDAEINERGILIDASLASAACRLADTAIDELNARICEATGGAVAKASQRARLMCWLKEQ